MNNGFFRVDEFFIVFGILGSIASKSDTGGFEFFFPLLGVSSPRKTPSESVPVSTAVVAVSIVDMAVTAFDKSNL